MQKKRNWSFIATVSLIILLLAFGILSIIHTYSSYVKRFVEIQDSKQLQLAQAVDRNMESLLTQSRNSLEYILDLEQFKEAERQWQLYGKNSQLLLHLTENHLSRNELIAGIAVLQDGQFLQDEHGRRTYEFINDDTDSKQRICVSASGKIYLAVICEGSGNASYASMIDLQKLYQKISSTELTESDQLILLDRNCSIYQHYCTDSHEFKTTFVEDCPEREDFRLLLAAEQQQNQDCFPFYYKTNKMTVGYNAHIMVLPSDSGENQIFAIGLISNIDQALLPLKAASIRWILAGSALLLGISLLLLLVLYLRRRDSIAAEELELLRQKNIAMEELNRKTQEIAHHQRLEMMGTLTSGIAHEFNNLLTPIMGYSMLTLEQLPLELEDLYDNVLEIYNSSRKAKEITSQLSQFSRKNTGESREYLSPNLLIQSVLKVAMPACPEAVSVKQEHEEISAKVYCNQTQLSQLFLNLIINAFHAMPDGGELSISTAMEQDEIIITVKDEGCGISETVLPHIFEPFFTTKEGGKGSGLGLAIAQQIVEDHQGHIEVHSKENEGTAFTVRLPAYFC